MTTPPESTIRLPHHALEAGTRYLLPVPLSFPSIRGDLTDPDDPTSERVFRPAQAPVLGGSVFGQWRVRNPDAPGIKPYHWGRGPGGRLTLLPGPDPRDPAEFEVEA